MIGEIVNGRYQIESFLGRGGMGTVYRALDQTEQRSVALKMLNLGIEGDSIPARFYREFRVLARIDHPHIVHAYDYGLHQGAPYLALEFLEGQTLKEIIDNGPMPREQLLRVAQQLCEALVHIHAQSLVHRDLKPGNIMLVVNGDDPEVKLMDFGLVRLTELSAELTQEGSAIGTVTYMSPEQAQGYTVDFSSDLYSLGVILYEMATGRPPFAHENPATVLLKQITSTPRSPRELNPELDEPLAQFILQLLSKDRNQRPASTKLAANHIANLLDDSSFALPIAVQTEIAPKVPLIGQEDTMQKIKQDWLAVLGGSGRTLLLEGPAGAGKGRVLTEVMLEAHLDSKQFLRGVNREHGSLPYQPFIDVFKQLIRRLSPEERQDLSPELSRLMPDISHLPVPPSNTDQAEARLRLFAACWQLLDACARKKPRLIVIEDLQWADATTLELLDYLAQRIHEAPILFVLTYRSEELDRGSSLEAMITDIRQRPFTQCVEVPLLTRDQVAIFLRAWLGREKLPGWFVDSFFAATDGNPLFIEETLKVLAAEGQVEQWAQTDDTNSSTRMTTTTQLGAGLQLPQSVLAIAERRLQTVPDKEKAILTTAAIVGPEFPFELLQKVTRQDEEDLIDALDWLLATNLLEELPLRDGEDWYAFRQEALRQALLTTVSQRRLRLLHKQTGEAMQSLYDTSQPNYWPILAYHFAEGGKLESALKYLTLAGDAAVNVYAYDEAIAHYTAALEIAQKVSPNRSHWHHLYMQRGRMMEISSRHREALQNYLELAQVAQELGDADLELASLLSRATLFVTPTPVYDNANGRSLSHKALDMAQELGNRAAEAKAEWNLLIAYNDKAHRAASHGERAIAIARELNLREQLAFALNDMHWPYLIIGENEKAMRASKEAQDLWRELGNLPMLTDNLTNSAGLHFLTGNLTDAFTNAQEAYNISEKIGNLWGQAYSRWPVQYYYVETGELDQAITAFREGIRLCVEAGLIHGQVTSQADLGWLFASLGAKDEALLILQKAKDFAETSFTWGISYTDAMLGRLYTRFNELEKAAEYLDKHPDKFESAASLGAFFMFNAKIELAMRQANYERATMLIDMLHDYAQQGNIRIYMPDVFTYRGYISLIQGDFDTAYDHLQKIYDLAKEIGSRRLLLDVLIVLRRWALQVSQPDKAEQFRQEAAAIVAFMLNNLSDYTLQSTFVAQPEIQTILDTGEG